MEDPEKVTIGTNHTQNTTDTPSEKNFNREECGDIVDDEGYDDQEKGGDIVDNRSKAPPSKVTIGAKHTHNTTKLRSAPPKVTTHTQTSTDTDTKKNYRE